MTTEALDLFGMSDEDFLNQAPTLEAKALVKEEPESQTEETATAAQTEETTTEEPTETAEAASEGTETGEETAEAAQETDAQKEERLRNEKGQFTAAKKDAAVAPAKDTAAKPEGQKTPEQTAAEVESAPTNYEGLYKQIMAPFKANGRTIELKDPKEAVQLMQMGANYTKKMQELVPHRKVLTMLQNNGLLDESKLSYLIDLDRKDPEAIKKLVKDAGIDPTDIDTSVEPAYRSGSHIVSDEESNFHTALEDMKSSPERMETLKVINDGWDHASKEALWKQPAIMGVIHQHREDGTYERIAGEVARRQMLGAISSSVPFINAYHQVGAEMQQAAQRSAVQAPVVKAPVATRVQAPKPKVTNSEKAAAATPTRSSASAKAPFKNPLEMSDEEFLKQMNGRL